MAHDLEAVKSYMRFDDLGFTPEEAEREAALIEMLRCSAVEYLAGAGIGELAESPLYDLAVCGLTLHYYDHRDTPGETAALPQFLDRVVVQLKLREAALRGAGGIT